MGKIIGYGKLGRSMPLTLEKCGNLGGDVEMVAVVKELALRHLDDEFILIGRNSGEKPSEIGLPPNIVNPWTEWGWKAMLSERVQRAGLKGVVLTSERQLELAKIFDDIVGATFDRLDGFVMWVGQHGTSNTPIPKVDDPSQLTKPQDWCAWYSGYMLRGINRWRDVDPWNREEVNLNSDPRNLHKMRDLKWPLRHPVLGQHNSWKWIKHHRGRDTRVPEIVDPHAGSGDVGWEQYATRLDDFHTWRAKVHTTYSRLEVNGLRPGTPFGDLISFNNDWAHRPGHFGLFINETRAIGIREDVARLPILERWILPLEPHFVHGTWNSLPYKDRIKPAPWDMYVPSLQSVRCTFTTPASGSGWATAKPWEAFAAGTVCFFHPAYDDQDNILRDAPDGLRDWLRVKTPDELRRGVAHLNSQSGRADWEWLVMTQRRHFDNALDDLTYMRMIEERIW